MNNNGKSLWKVRMSIFEKLNSAKNNIDIIGKNKPKIKT